MLRVTAFLRPARLLFCSTIIVRDMTCWDGAWPVSVSPTSHDLKPTSSANRLPWPFYQISRAL